jgi:hypothetical protein
MSITTALLLWYLTGLIASVLVIYTDYHKGYPLYLTDLLKYLLASILGVILLIPAIQHTAEWFYKDKIILQKKSDKEKA